VKYLVLGGHGFIGSHLVSLLLESGQNVRCFDLPSTTPLGVFRLDHPNLELSMGDFTNECDLDEALRDCDVCYHLVSTTLPKSSNLNPLFDIRTNLIGTVQMLQLCVKHGVRKVVFVSSGGTVYGAPEFSPITENHPANPICSYGITKLAIEKYLEMFRLLHGLDYTVLRLANPYGEFQRTHASQGAVAVFLGRALRGETIEIWGDGSVVRDYVHISDVTKALFSASQVSDSAHRVFNIGSGVGRDLNKLVDVIGRVMGHPLSIKYEAGRGFDVPVSTLDIGLANKALGWRPEIEFSQGVAQFYGWLAEDVKRLR